MCKGPVVFGMAGAEGLERGKARTGAMEAEGGGGSQRPVRTSLGCLPNGPDVTSGEPRKVPEQGQDSVRLIFLQFA